MVVRALVRRNLGHYWRTNLAVVGGVAVAVAVLAGALLVGTSVRSSLRALALERLGAIDRVVTTGRFVEEETATALLAADGMAARFAAAVPMVAVEGFVTHQASGRRASGVQVYGVDDRFWTFHGHDPDRFAFDRNAAFASGGLAGELGIEPEDALLVRVERPSAVPISSLHGRRDDVGRTLRLGVTRVLDPADLGEFSFRPAQGLARSVFVPLSRLQEELETEGRVNTLLLGGVSAGFEAADAGDDAARQEIAEAAVRSTAALADLGLRVRALPELGTVAVESDAGLLTDATVDAVENVAAARGLAAEPILSYLSNELRIGERVTPYSVITARDLSRLDAPAPAADAGAGPPPVILNQWTADDLGASPGDSLTIEYYLWEDEGLLTTQETELRVAGVVPIEGVAADPDLTPDYPGITEATDVIDWDPPFPVDLGLIRPVDETYWDDYRTTPKAFIPLAAGQEMWASRWGQVTSVRLTPADGGAAGLDAVAAEVGGALRETLDPLALGFVVYPARSLALEASAGATDFGLYFIYFSFFLVVSALLLASLFFRLGVEQRLRELGLLRATGWTPRAIRRLFLSEALVLSAAGSAIGVAGAVGYAWLIMLGFRTLWIDAVGTTRLALDPSPVTLAAGAAGGILAALLSIAWTLRALSPATPRSLLTGGVAEVTGVPRVDETGAGERRAGWIALGLGGAGIALIGAAALGVIGNTAGFFAGGMSLLLASLALAWTWMGGSPDRQSRGRRSLTQVGYRNAAYRPGRSVLCIALIAFAVFIIVAVDAFRRDGEADVTDRGSGTGGYTLLAESLLPIVHDPSSTAGQAELFIDDLFGDGEALAGVSLARFRLRPGEDASCLNLYQAKDPRVLAPTAEFLAERRFTFGATAAETPEEEANPWLLLDRTFDDGAIPAIADATSLAYALHLGIGDDFVLNRETDRPVTLRIVAALADSVFQGELLIGEANFERVFPDYDGYRVFLVDAPPDRMEEVSAALEDRLADFGFDAVSAAERLASFHRVENTYLATFQTLGGLGLILGTFGLGAILLRNVLERRRELALMRAVGYNTRHLSLMVLAENAFLLFPGLLAGTACAIVAIAPAWLERGGAVPVVSLAVLLIVVIAAGLTSSVAATVAAARTPLLGALRTE